MSSVQRPSAVACQSEGEGREVAGKQSDRSY